MTAGTEGAIFIWETPRNVARTLADYRHTFQPCPDVKNATLPVITDEEVRLIGELLAFAEQWDRAEFPFSLGELASCSRNAGGAIEAFVRKMFAGAWVCWFADKQPRDGTVPKQAAEFLFGLLRRLKAPPADEAARKHALAAVQPLAKRTCAASASA